MHAPNNPTTEPYCRLLIFFTFILFLCYSNTFTAAWQMDDRPNILKNQNIQMSDITVEQIWKSMHAHPISGELYRPVACLSLSLNWLVGQDRVFGYHLVNWLIHLGTSWLLFLTIQTLFHTPQIQNRYTPHQITFIAVLATLFWALNPVQTQAVTYIVQRMASMAALFSILSIYCYLQGRLSQISRKRKSLWAAGAVCYLLAVLSKENAITLPLTIPIFEFFFFQTKISSRTAKIFSFSLLIILTISALVAVTLNLDLLDKLVHWYDRRPFTLTERVLTEQRILLYYLSQLFFPHPSRLSITHDFPLSISLLSPWDTLAAIFANTMLVFLAVKISTKHQFFSLAILFFYLHHIVESTFIPLELVFEHRNYLPAFFLFIPLAIFINDILTSRVHSKTLRLSVIFLISILLAAEGYATFVRNSVWKDEQSLWIDALLKAPNSARPMASLAVQLGWGENPSEENCKKALKIIEHSLTMTKNRKKDNASLLGNAASLHTKLGEFDKSLQYYDQALKIIPNDPLTILNMVKVYVSIGDFKTAKNKLNDIKITDRHADYFHILGHCDLWLNLPFEAADALREAMVMNPLRPDILLSLGKSLSLTGYYNRAKWFIDLSRTKGGENLIVSLCLIENCLLQQETKLAKSYLKELLDNVPIPTIFTILSEPSKQYQTVPMNRVILIPFIQNELKMYTDEQNMTHNH